MDADPSAAPRLIAERLGGTRHVPDFAPDRSAWAVVSTPVHPSITEHNPATVPWGSLRVDPDLVGVVPEAACASHLGIGVRGGDDLWTLPVRHVLAAGLAWHPHRSLVAGLTVRERRLSPWVADYRARTVTVYEHVRAATSLTGHGRGRRHPPLAWCDDARLALLIPGTAQPAGQLPSPVSRPGVYEAAGPGFISFAPDPDELARLASVHVALLDTDGGAVSALTAPALVRSMTRSADGGDLLLAHVDLEGDSPERDGGPPDTNGLRWANVLVDTRVPGRPRPAPAGAGRPADDRSGGNQPGHRPAPSPEQAASGAVAVAGRPYFAVPTGFGSAALTVFPGEERAAPGPMLLWITDTRPGQGVTDRAPLTLAATGNAVATLDLPLHWPSDATVAMLHRQIVDTVRTALTNLADHSNGTVVVAGHSFGATLALYALAHIPELAAAIVHSGCYNRTLTPAGFQHERRAYWTEPDLYHAFSALHFADRLDRPVLIAHGAEDQNPATTPEQAVGLYRGIVATGGHARLVLLPHEGHNFRHRENLQTLVEEHRTWVDRLDRVLERD